MGFGGPVDAVEQSMNATFLIQNLWGGIVGIQLAADRTPSVPAVVRPMASEFPMTSRFPEVIGLEAFSEGAYQLMSNGYVHPIGNAKPPAFSWTFIRNTECFAIMPNGQGGWIAAGEIIKTVGRPPNLIFPPMHRKVTDMEYATEKNHLIVLFEDGEIVICKPDSFEFLSSLELFDDDAIRVKTIADGYYVLTKNANVFYVTKEKSELYEDVPDQLTGLARDIEISPFGVGFYILDGFGVIHACGGAPEVPTEPFTNDIAVDLEIIEINQLPQWYPIGWYTAVELIPHELALDPDGDAKSVSLMIHEAENLSFFSAELKYDPALLTVPVNGIKNGEWWESVMNGAQVLASFKSAEGVIRIKGGGSFSPFEGPSGKGELIRLDVKPKKNVRSATTRIEIQNFLFVDSSQFIQYGMANIISSATVVIRPSRPRLFLRCTLNDKVVDCNELNGKPGDLLQIDIMAEDGSRISEFLFGFQFPCEILHFLGMVSGSVWRQDVVVRPEFEIPSVANQKGGLERQRITADASNACQDRAGALVNLFFQVTKTGEGRIVFDSIETRDKIDLKLELDVDINEVLFFCR
ncbi:MAG: hypothetical protein C4527_07485 [Candidatus Omnitrophota bacterium]|jgi:hypothetical protein|nr:MAG: hypothetical protein C4527_07485 [Candidatus Omnitrophota bacterium]